MSGSELFLPNRSIMPDGRVAGHVVFYDIDGTAVRQDCDEADKLATADPAMRALSRFAQHGIPHWPITARSRGEAEFIAQVLGGDGSAIAEDGAVASRRLPDGRRRDIVLSRVNRMAFAQFVRLVDLAATDEVYSSLTLNHTIEDLQMAAGHHSLYFTGLSADRAASAYIAKPQQSVRDAVARLAPWWPDIRVLGIDDMDGSINLNPADADKADALQTVCEQPDVFFPELGVDCIRPIVFGNHKNDRRMLGVATKRLGGVAVLVGKSHLPNDFYIDPPNYVIATSGEPYGFGMLAAVRPIAERLNQLSMAA